MFHPQKAKGAIVPLIGAALLGGACSPRSVPPPPAVASVSVPSPPPTPTPPPAPWDAFATLHNAGAKECTLTHNITLGPTVEDAPAVAFGPAGGLAAWKQPDATLGLQPLARDGDRIGAPVLVPLDPSRRVMEVYALDRSFVVLLLLWDIERSIARWWGLEVSPAGIPRGAPVDLKMDDMSIRFGQPLDAESIGLWLLPANVALHRFELHGRWQTVRLAGGTLTSTPTDVPVDDLLTRTDETAEPATLAGLRGWVVLREGVRRPEGIFGGKRLPAAGAALLRPPDGLEFSVHNLAIPVPRGPDGRIYEMLPRPALLRSHAGKPVGTRFEFEPRHVAVSYEVVWTGTHFVNSDSTRLIAIDCRAPTPESPPPAPRRTSPP